MLQHDWIDNGCIYENTVLSSEGKLLAHATASATIVELCKFLLMKACVIASSF